MASYTEIFLLSKFAPELLTKSGKVSVLFLYLVWTAIATYGFLNCKIEFQFDLFLTDEDMSIYKYVHVEKKYFNEVGYKIHIYANNTDIDYYSIES